MEVGQCVAEHILWPLKRSTTDVVMLALTFADAQVRQFFQSLSAFLQKSMLSLVGEGDGTMSGVDLTEVHKVTAAAANAACMKELEKAASYRQMPGMNLTDSMLRPITVVAPAVAKSAIKLVVEKIGKFATYDLFAPLVRKMLGVMQDAASDMLLLLDGLCGVIPELGGLICDSFEMPLNGAIVWTQEPMFAEAIKFVSGLFQSLAEKVSSWVADKVQDVADLGRALAKDLSTKAAAVVEDAISKVKWIGEYVDKGMIHWTLDTSFAGIIHFLSELLAKMAPDVEAQVQQCMTLRKVIVGLA
eukprot:SRR837773.5577.p1 GENE.SRR837773.5577~~SRR837773.5577.p1  ORF type:complete len:330 (-),score=96.91 SRR837773.5577:62-967(-)